MLALLLTSQKFCGATQRAYVFPVMFLKNQPEYFEWFLLKNLEMFVLSSIAACVVRHSCV